MPSAPANEFAELARDVVVFLVWQGEDGERPVKEDETESLRLARIVRTAGGGALDYAQFTVDLGHKAERAVDMETPEAWNRQVEVRITDDNGEPTGFAAFWGALSHQAITLSPRQEACLVTARVEPRHFGGILEGMKVRQPFAGIADTHEIVTVHDDPILNPVIDGVIICNRSNHQDTTDPENPFYLWVNPESTRTPDARQFQDENAIRSWTLADIIHTLCRMLNPDEDFITNPTREDLDATIGIPVDIWQPSTAYNTNDKVTNGGKTVYNCTQAGVSASSGGPTGTGTYADGSVQWQSITTPACPEIANLMLRRGAYLPAYLDALLTPHGFGWFLRPSFAAQEESEEEDAPAPEMIRKISIFRRGDGIEREIFLQRPGEDLDPAESNTQDLAVETSIADMANQVVGVGSKQQRELTIPLQRGWEEADDHFTADDLNKQFEANNPTDYPTHQKVWRYYPANEAGDHTGLRSVVAPTGEPLDLRPYFEKFVPKRRKIEDCLTKDATGKRRPPFLEWLDLAVRAWNPSTAYSVGTQVTNGENAYTCVTAGTSAASGGPTGTGSGITDGTIVWNYVSEPGTWKPVPIGSYSILENEIGVMFTGDKPPEEGPDRSATMRLRITGTITGDTRLTREAVRRESSPNGEEIILYLDLADRFHDRQVETEGEFKSVLADSPYGADVRDDGDDLQTYVDLTRNDEDAAVIKAAIRLHGICLEYEIGDLITRVSGRNISFNRNSPSSSDKRYLQITGIEYDRQEQATILRVETMDDEGFEVNAEFGQIAKVRRMQQRGRKQ